jgi:hypothetical protein
MRPALQLARILSVSSVVLVFASLTANTPALAAPRKITGKLSKPGFTVIALDVSGEATSVRARPNGRFRLRPTAKRVTLHLRAPDGTYAGPIVMAVEGKKGRRAIVGVKAGTDLGRVKVRSTFAKVKRELPREDLNRKLWSRAKRGVPIGAGVFGRVPAGATGPAGPGLDLDRDGLPGALDIDDDGDLVLDSLEASAQPPVARTTRGTEVPTELFDVFTVLELPLESTANANAPGSTDAQIESALPGSGQLVLHVLPGDSPELDCGGTVNPSPPPPLVGGLVYCSTGGTGSAQQADGSSSPFPDDFDPDGDGFGSLVGVAPPGGSTPAMFLAHGATTDQIATGDVLIQRVIRGGSEIQFPTTIQFVFATVPALASYGDTAGNGAAVSYPVSPGGSGTQGNGFQVKEGLDGDVLVTVTLWRPQRRPIDPETGEWIDIGGLTYSTIVGHLGPLGTPPGGTSVNQPCPQSAHSTTHPELAPPPDGQAGAFVDLAPDRPADPANTPTYSVNLTECLASLGHSWNPGEELSIGFSGVVTSSGAIAGGAGQTVWFRLMP